MKNYVEIFLRGLDLVAFLGPYRPLKPGEGKKIEGLVDPELANEFVVNINGKQHGLTSVLNTLIFEDTSAINTKVATQNSRGTIRKGLGRYSGKK